MPIYEPDASTDVAIQSLLNQTWTNIEVLIIDDASPQYFEDGTSTPYRQQLEAWARTDSRIRLTFCEQNRGAYAVRNEAFASAQGEFVTVADKDDWHHPQKIERQARDLQAHPRKHANIVNWVRVDEDLKFLVRWGPDRVVHPSFASIMYRRVEVMEKLGYWDAVRKSADGEYRTRFEIAFGEKLVATDHVPMAFSLLGDGNLTSNDFGLGYRHPDREIYQDAYGDWHKRIRSGASPFMPEDPGDRRFVGPTSFLPERDKSHVPHYDVIYLSEFGLQGGNALTLEREIRTALDSGLKVGIVALQNGLIPSASKRRIVPVLERLFLDGSVDRLTLDRVATAELMLIHWPTVMQLLPAAESAIQPERIVVVANQLPGLMSQSRQSYDAADVSRNCGEIFGQHPVWAAQSSFIYEALRAMLPSTQLSKELWLGIAPKDGPTRVPDFGNRPILGRPMDEEERNWPKTKSARESLLPTNGSAEVLLEGRPELMVRERILAEPLAPLGWTIEYPSPEGPSAYLGRIDFYLGHTRDSADESTEPYIVEAMRQGVVCILPPRLRGQFGEAAIYAEPREVPEVIDSSWNPQEYVAQQERGLAFVQSHRTVSDYLHRIG
nr:glycosyltransferase family A protein [Nesterenkonia sp. LB17]